jgi:CDGSH-type Zn-finger protein
MARLVIHEATGPIEVKPQTQSVWICACGLTQTAPFCDGSHKAAKQNDKPDGVCVYARDKKTVVELKKDFK